MGESVYSLILSYLGTAYAGWQRQLNAVAVQERLEEALEALAGRPVRTVGAGRTDAGVHARGQVVHLDLEGPFELRALVHGTNHHLPEDIRVLAARRMGEGFHARKHAAGKRYDYRMVRGGVLSPLDEPFAILVPPDLDAGAITAAAEALPGRHDFTAFALAGGSHDDPRRTIHRAELAETPSGLILRLEADGFLRGMVRSIAGTLIEVGRARRSPEDFGRLLAGAPRSAAGPTAPARGLTLKRVDYPAAWRSLDAYDAAGGAS